MTKIRIQTGFDDAEIEIIRHNDEQRFSMHCHMPPCGGAPVFALFDDNEADMEEALEIMRQVINCGSHPPDKNMTDQFTARGCLAVGTAVPAADVIRNSNFLGIDLMKDYQGCCS